MATLTAVFATYIMACPTAQNLCVNSDGDVVKIGKSVEYAMTLKM